MLAPISQSEQEQMYIDKALETLRRIYAQKENKTRKLRSEQSNETQRQKKNKDKGNVAEGFALCGPLMR